MGYRFSGQSWSGLREALQSASGHSVVAIFEWGDSGIFRKKKEYFLTITQLSAQEARARFGSRADGGYDAYIAVMMAGDVPPSVQARLESSENVQGWLVSWGGFFELMSTYFPDAISGDWTPA